MWTQPTPSGKIRYFDRDDDGKIVSVTLNDAKKSTEKLARQLLMEKMKKDKVSPKTDTSMTFETMITQYKRHLAKEMKAQTAAAADFQFRPIVRMIGPETFVRDLTAPYVRSCLFDGSPSKYNERLKHFKAALRWAYREEIVPDVDFLDRLPKMRSEARREALADKYLEADELKALLGGMKEDRWQLLTEFLVLSGLRIGEAMALEQKDVDLAKHQITINKTYSLIINTVSQTAKTSAGNRIVSIQDELEDCIHRINAITPRRRKLFFDYDGFINYPTYAKYFRENTERLVGRRLTPHALRHTHVALLAAAGIPLDVISRRLGHSDSAVTREVYFHVTKKLMEKDADQLRMVKIL